MNLLSVLRALARFPNLWDKTSRRVSIQKRWPRRPRLEVLDDRINPSNTVLATFAAGGLVLTGDALNNALEITQGTDDRLTLTGFPGTQVRLNGGLPQNGLTLPAPVTAGVAINLGGGADVLYLTGVDLPGLLTINGGDGGNRLILQNGVTVRGTVTVTNGVGFDQISLFGAVTMAGGLTITNGAGGSRVADDTTTDLQVTGALTITNGAGADTVSLVNASRISVGRLLVSHGPGLDANVTEFIPGRALTVGTTVRVTGGAGSDTVTLGGETVSVGGGVAINNGAGGSTTRLAPAGGLFVGGTVNVTATAGFDGVQVGDLRAATAVGGGVLVSVGDGGGYTTITGTRLTIGGSVRIAAGAGSDYAEIDAVAGDGAVGGGVTVGLGAGDGQTVIVATLTAGTSLVVGGALHVVTGDVTPGPGGDQILLRRVRVGLGTAITTGAGSDFVYVDESSFGTFTLTTGAGDDAVQIERNAASGTTRFRGAVRVNTGDGNDTVRVGNSSPGVDQAVFAADSVWDGGPGVNDTINILGRGNLFFGPAAFITGFEVLS